MSLRLTALQPLAATHQLDDFACGEASLDDWLRRRALVNQQSGASRTFVVTDEEGRVLAYYALAVGAVADLSSVVAEMPPGRSDPGVRET